MDVDVAEASSRLGVSPQRVRHLIHEGALPARRVAGRYVLDANVLAQAAENRTPGRPLSPRIAWGLVLLLERGEAPELTAAERSKVRRRLRGRPDLAQVARWARRRNRTTHLHVHRAAVPRALQYPGAVRTGACASGHDLVDAQRAELYLRPQHVAGIRRALHAEPVDSASPGRSANLIVHMPATGEWPFDNDEAGPLTVALDLWDAGDARSRRASQRLYDSVLRARRFEPGAR